MYFHHPQYSRSFGLRSLKAADWITLVQYIVDLPYVPAYGRVIRSFLKSQTSQWITSEKPAERLGVYKVSPCACRRQWRAQKNSEGAQNIGVVRDGRRGHAPAKCLENFVILCF